MKTEITDPDEMNDPIAVSCCCADEGVDEDVMICPTCRDHCDIEWYDNDPQEDEGQTRQDWLDNEGDKLMRMEKEG